MIDGEDRGALRALFERRLRVADNDAASAAYFAGRIDGYCLQNAISYDELVKFAVQRDYSIDWVSALLGGGSS